MRTKRRSPHAALAPLIAAGMLAGCAAGMQGGDQPLDPSIAARAAAATAPSRPLHIVFDWTLTQRDARFSGQGAARVAPEYHARLDLFGPRGEAYMSAALVGTELRFAAALDAGAELPPPELLWTVLGSFHPPANAELAATWDDGATTRVEYARAGERWRYRFTDGVLVHAEWDAGRSGRRTVELRARGDAGLPTQAVYRDWLEFRELTLTLTQVDEVEAFPPDTWRVGR